MKRLGLATTLGLAAGLAACGKPQAAAPLAPATTPAAASDMANMDMSAGAKMAKGSGTVTAVDAKAGTITLDHGPIPEANWPAMTMTFKAAPAVTSAVKTGAKVDFDVKIQGGAGEVTAVRRP